MENWGDSRLKYDFFKVPMSKSKLIGCESFISESYLNLAFAVFTSNLGYAGLFYPLKNVKVRNLNRNRFYMYLSASVIEQTKLYNSVGQEGIIQQRKNRMLM